MVASEFYIYGPAIASDTNIVEAEVTGIELNGSIQFSRTDSTFTLTTDKVRTLDNDNLIVSKSKAQGADPDLISALTNLPTLPADASEPAKDALDRAREELFRTIVQSVA